MPRFMSQNLLSNQGKSKFYCSHRPTMPADPLCLEAFHGLIRLRLISHSETFVSTSQPFWRILIYVFELISLSYLQEDDNLFNLA